MKTFSVNALGELLEKDRGLVVRALRGVIPDATERGAPRYRMAVAVAALERHAGNANRSNGGGDGTSFELQRQYVLLDQLADKVRNATTVAKRRKLMRGEFFETLFQVTMMMYADAKGSVEDNAIFRIAEHERTSLMVLRHDCAWNADEMLTEYNAIVARHFDECGELIGK